jgi:hypothetical protein
MWLSGGHAYNKFAQKIQKTGGTIFIHDNLKQNQE